MLYVQVHLQTVTYVITTPSVNNVKLITIQLFQVEKHNVLYVQLFVKVVMVHLLIVQSVMIIIIECFRDLIVYVMMDMSRLIVVFHVFHVIV